MKSSQLFFCFIFCFFLTGCTPPNYGLAEWTVTPEIKPIVSPTSPAATPLPTQKPTPILEITQTPTVLPIVNIYNENFEDGQPKNWSVFSGTWNISTEGNNHYWNGSGPTNYPQAFYGDGDLPWKNYVFESRIRFHKGTVFICLRTTGGSSFMNASLSSDNNGVDFASYNGKDYKTDGSVNYNFNTNQWYLVRLEIEGNVQRLYIDNKLIKNTSWINTPNSQGGIGYYLSGGSDVDFDDIKIWNLGLQPTPQPSFDIYSSPQFNVSTLDYQNYGNLDCFDCLIKNQVELKKPGNQSYQVSYPNNKPIYFRDRWCTIDQTSLQSNVSNMDLTLQIDNVDIPIKGDYKKFIFTETTNYHPCQYLNLIISGLNPGMHTIHLVHIFNKDINDGWSIYPAGNYDYIYKVNIASN